MWLIQVAALSLNFSAHLHVIFGQIDWWHFKTVAAPGS